ncbi:MAG: CNNM domain-containing protein [Bacteroidota bacterium]|nr:CNNM domain-containing protein [Bacteroidota bacterium]MDP3146127.1 CNNM domain-containing protein [Bacteroidota bacterium]MDP3556715.1 CNNM domain-containing protein [Bacteroidota bacterium]
MLVILSGTFAGLTLSLFGIRLTTLERKMKLGNANAAKVYKLRKKGNLLLCTLLLANVTCYTIMAIFLGSLTTGIIAGFVGTSLAFIFGEILPQAIFPRYTVLLGARLRWLVWIALVVYFPIAFPISWLLDKIIGEEPPLLWTKKEIEEIIKFHEVSGNGIIDKDEERIVLGALSFSDKKVEAIMIPLNNVFYLESGTKINLQLLNQIRSKGFSRIPIYNTNERKIIGILYAKNLIGLADIDGKLIDDLCSKDSQIIVNTQMELDSLLNLLVKRKMHMALVIDADKNFRGVVTMEDIMEEILKTELEDLKL